MDRDIAGKVVCVVKYKTKAGMRDEFTAAIKAANLEERYRKQPGNIIFSFSVSFTEDDTAYLVDIWEDQETFNAHITCDVAPDLAAIKAKYVEETTLERFGAPEAG